MNFKQIGIFQQHGALFIQLGRILDSLAIFFALYFGLILYHIAWNHTHLVAALLGIIFFETTSSFYHLYRPWRIMRLSQEVTEVFINLSVSFAFIATALYLFEFEEIHNDVVILWFTLAFFLIALYRGCARILLRSFRSIGYDHRNVCFIGTTVTAKNLAESFKSHPWMGIDILGFFDADTSMEADGTIDDVLALSKQGKIDAVYITLPMSAEKQIKKIIDALSDTTVSVFYCPSFADFNLLNARWDDVYGQPIISIIDSPFRGISGYIKRLEDLLLVSLILPLIALPMAVIAIAIKLTSAGPIFYLQSRYGLDGKEFKIFKFRSMYTTDSDKEFVQATQNDPRVTPLGRFLRKSSLDELPQFINVLLGDMSIVGPRPHPIKLNETHRTQIFRYMIRHKVKPGITGLAQVNGFRGETDSLFKMEKRIEYDLQYMKEWSLWLDFKILIMTFFTIFYDINAY